MVKKKDHSDERIEEDDNKISLQITIDDTARMIRYKHDLQVYESPKWSNLIRTLKNWVNDYTFERKKVVKNMFRDFTDGYLLAIFYRRISNKSAATNTQFLTSVKEKQIENLDNILSEIDEDLGTSEIHRPWSPFMINNGCPYATVSLLIHLSLKYGNIKMDPFTDLCFQYVIEEYGKVGFKPKEVQKSLIFLSKEQIDNLFIQDDTDLLYHTSRDKFDKFYEIFRQFVNQEIKDIHLTQVNHLAEEVSDGVILIKLSAIMGNYFISDTNYVNDCNNDEEKLQNVKLALELLTHCGLNVNKVKADDIVKADPICTFRLMREIVKFKSKPNDSD